MMNQKKETYEKPMVKFVSVQSDNAIADECWSSAAANKGYTWNYDIKGEGYVSFQVTPGSCAAASPTNILYYEGTDDQEPELITGGDKYTELSSQIKQYANSPNFKGSDSIFPSQPDPSWS